MQSSAVNDLNLVNELHGNVDLQYIPFQQKEKFEKFYERSTGDYVFKIENMPDAFDKLDEIETFD